MCVDKSIHRSSHDSLWVILLPNSCHISACDPIRRYLHRLQGALSLYQYQHTEPL